VDRWLPIFRNVRPAEPPEPLAQHRGETIMAGQILRLAFVIAGATALLLGDITPAFGQTRPRPIISPPGPPAARGRPMFIRPLPPSPAPTPSNVPNTNPGRMN